MIKKEKRIIQKKSKEDVEKTQAFKLGKGNHKNKNKLEYDMNIKTGAGWFFVIVGNEANGLTEMKEGQRFSSLYEIIEKNTEQECLDRIVELGLIYNKPNEV